MLAPQKTLTQGSPWQLVLLGHGQLTCDGAVVRLERKTAALFAYLALEGPTSRSKLAGLLWPDSSEDAARSSLRQRLYRLRGSVGTDLVVSDEPLRLDPTLEVDAVRFESLVFTNEYARALELEDGLLVGNDYDDCPDLSEWVLAARERLEGIRREALAAQANRLEAAGDYAAALSAAERLLVRDPISEDAHRRVMRLHYLAGDRPAAIRAFEHCRAVLETQLGVTPLPETLTLATLISRGDGLPETMTPDRHRIPIQVLRPPILAGREREWAQLEAAWEARQVVFIGGAPGSGKTRLMLDFAGSKGKFSSIEGRSGDAGVPYSTHARNLKRTLSEMPELLERLEPWVRRELSRLLPELEPEAPAPIRDETEKLRFFQAIAHLTRIVIERGHASIVLDDLQFMDAGSFEVGTFITTRSFEDSEHFPRSLNAYRSHELSPEIASRIHELVNSGVAILIELEPLEEEAVAAMIGGIEITNLERLAAALTRYTGGNPLFIVETIKHLIETNQVSKEFPAQLPPPGKVGALIRRRLERLSSGALRVAQVAAIAETDFTLELAAKILEVGAFELTAPFAELELAQVLVGERFAHDLIFEATRERIPVPIKTLVHRRTAQHLERLKGDPARIAYHWLEAGLETQAVPWLLESASVAQAAFRKVEAVDFLERAVQVLGSQERARAFDVLERLVRLLIEFDTGARHEAFLEQMFALASGPAELARAWNEKAELLTLLGREDELDRATQEGLAAAQDAGVPLVEASLLEKKAFVLEDQGRLVEALEVYAKVQTILERTDRHADLAASYSNMAMVLDKVGRSRESILALDRAQMLHPDEITKLRIRHNKAMCLAEYGLIRQAQTILEDVLSRLSEHPNETRLRLVGLITSGRVNQFLARYAAALTQLNEGSTLDPEFLHWRKGDLHRMLGATYLELGQFEQAEFEIGRAIHESNLPAGQLGMAWLLHARRLAYTNEPFMEALGRAEELIRSRGDARQVLHFRFTHAGLLPDSEGLQIALEELELGATHQFDGPQIAARTRAAQALLALGDVRAASHSAEAVRLLEQFDSPHIPRAEILFTHAQALTSVGDRGARIALEYAVSWLLEVANNHVPPEYHKSFLIRNPVNAAILEAARNAGLEVPASVTLQ
jgi:DNA-binding SARP family transcriptional activator